MPEPEAVYLTLRCLTDGCATRGDDTSTIGKGFACSVGYGMDDTEKMATAIGYIEHAGASCRRRHHVMEASFSDDPHRMITFPPAPPWRRWWPFRWPFSKGVWHAT